MAAGSIFVTSIPVSLKRQMGTVRRSVSGAVSPAKEPRLDSRRGKARDESGPPTTGKTRQRICLARLRR